MATPIIYNGHDNPMDRVFRAVDADGVPVLVGADQFTRFVLHLDNVAIDSSIVGLGAGQPFDNSLDVEVGKQTTKMLRMKLGAQGVTAGTYRAKLVAYDVANPNGIVWAQGFSVKVVE